MHGCLPNWNKTGSFTVRHLLPSLLYEPIPSFASCSCLVNFRNLSSSTRFNSSSLVLIWWLTKFNSWAMAPDLMWSAETFSNFLAKSLSSSRTWTTSCKYRPYSSPYEYKSNKNNKYKYAHGTQSMIIHGGNKQSAEIGL